MPFVSNVSGSQLNDHISKCLLNEAFPENFVGITRQLIERTLNNQKVSENDPNVDSKFVCSARWLGWVGHGSTEWLAGGWLAG